MRLDPNDPLAAVIAGDPVTGEPTAVQVAAGPEVEVVEVLVVGDAAAKGSPKVVTRGRGGVPLPFPRVLKDSAKTYRWERMVATAAMLAMQGRAPFRDRPLDAQLVFATNRPRGHFGKRGLLPSAPLAPATKPDADKLARSTLDALQGVVFDDDSRIVRLDIGKVYVPDGEAGGALIRVKHAAPITIGELTMLYRARLREHLGLEPLPAIVTYQPGAQMGLGF